VKDGLPIWRVRGPVREFLIQSVSQEPFLKPALAALELSGKQQWIWEGLGEDQLQRGGWLSEFGTCRSIVL